MGQPTPPGWLRGPAGPAVFVAGASASGREALDGPVRPLTAVTQPVVQPAGPALPELDDVVPEPVATPEAGHRNDRALRPALFQPRVTPVQHGPRADHRRLPARPG